MISISVYYQVKFTLKKADVEFKKNQIAQMEIAEQVEAQYHEALNSYNAVKVFVDSTHSDNVMLLKFIEDLEKVMPTGTSINNLRANDGYVTFEVASTSKEAVADVIVTMKSLDYVSDVSIPSINDLVVDVDETEDEDEETEEVESELVGEEYIRSNSIVTYTFSCKLTDLDYKKGTESEVLDPSALENEEGDE